MFEGTEEITPASFALMDALALDTAFTFDTDFRSCGYNMVPLGK